MFSQKTEKMPSQYVNIKNCWNSILWYYCEMNAIDIRVLVHARAVRGHCNSAFVSRAHTCIVFYFSKRVPRGSTKYVWRILFLKRVSLAGRRVVGGAGEGVDADGGAGVRGAAPVGFRGEAPAGGSGGGAPHCHETNLKCFMNKLCHEMRQLNEQFVQLLVSLPGFRRQQCVADDSVRLCVQFLYN